MVTSVFVTVQLCADNSQLQSFRLCDGRRCQRLLFCRVHTLSYKFCVLEHHNFLFFGEPVALAMPLIGSALVPQPGCTYHRRPGSYMLRQRRTQRYG